MRVHELAKQLGVSSKDLLARLHGLGIEAKNVQTSLTEKEIKWAIESIEDEKAEAEEALAEAAGTASTPEPAPEKDEPVEPAPAPEPVTPAPPAPEPAPPVAPPAPVAPKPAPAIHPPAMEVPPALEATRVTLPFGAPPAPAPAAAPAAPTAPKPGEPIQVHGQVVVKDFAPLLGLKPNILIAELMRMNIFASINEKIDFKIAQKLAEKHGVKIELEKKKVEPSPAPKKKEVKPDEPPERPEEKVSRPPVVTFMGHVDHGKTSLLDYIRKTRVAAGEAGGITQHMGAYMVTHNDKPITFIDTPGHAAFTRMRARGANVTDIAVIVIAADEGIMPQTREAIQHARAANVTIMVALNKIDLPGANVDRVLSQLQKEGLNPEQWGGDVICCPVSAATGDGVNGLLEMILLQADMMELKAAVKCRARGRVLEARLEPGMGPTATLLVQQGTLQVGDAVVCGDHWGRIKALINDRGIKVRSVAPSFAVQCLGLTAVPEAGSEFVVHASDREARSLSDQRLEARRLETLQAPKRGLSLDDLFNQTDKPTITSLPLVLKADVQGSLEAIAQSLMDIKSTKVKVNIVLSGVGNITVNDVLLAKASNAIIIGFHISADEGVNKAARQEGVEIRLYSIIYELLDEVRAAMAGLLEPIIKETVIGQAEVQQVFSLTKKGNVAGCVVKSGRISARARARLRRGGSLVFDGSIGSLKRFQNDASEVRDGQECGIRLDNFQDYQTGDIIEAYEVQKIAPQL